MRNGKLALAFGLGLLTASACTGSIEGDDPGGGSGSNQPPATDVQLVVRDGYTPQAGVRVIFQAADDSVISDTVTDATGLAKADLPSGGNLTVIRTFPVPPPPAERRAPEVYTYVGVKNGDKLVLGDQTSAGAPGAIVVKVPDAANGTVKVDTPCGSGQGTAPNVAITVTDCPPMVGFYVTDGNQSSFFKMAPYAENVDLSLEALSGNLAATLGSTNVPANTTVTVEERVVSGTFQLFSSGAKRVDQTAATVNLPNITGVDQLVVTTIKTTGSATQMVATRSAYSASPAVVDATANLIADISAPMYTPTSVTWTEGSAGTADAVIVTLNVTRGGPTAIDNTYTRAIIAPHAGPSLRLPVLPDALYNPAMGDQIAGTSGLVSATGGYDALKALAFTVPNILDAGAADGTITLAYPGNTPPGI